MFANLKIGDCPSICPFMLLNHLSRSELQGTSLQIAHMQFELGSTLWEAALLTVKQLTGMHSYTH